MPERKLTKRELEYLHYVAVNDAALALRASTKALIKWADAEAFFAKKLFARWQVNDAKANWEKAHAERLMMDARVDYLKKMLEGR